MIVPKGMPVVAGIHLSVLFIKEDLYIWEVSVHLSIRKFLGEPKKRNNIVVVAKNIGSHPNRG